VSGLRAGICRRALTAIVVLLASSVAAFAQARPARSVSGIVFDSTGAVLPFAQITLLSSSGATVATATTDGTGAFVLEGVPRGRYQVRAALQGFQTKTTPVTVGASPGKALRITLALSGVHQEITVTNSTPQVSVGATANADAVTVDQSAIDALPIFDNDAIGTISRFLDSGSTGSGGVTILVNGMEVNSLDVGTAAIQQIKINQDPYSAAYSRPGRGRIDILTNPGSAQFHGNASAVFRDSGLNARNTFADVKPPEQRRIGDGFLGGPLGRGGKTSFMLSLSDDSEDRQAIVFARGLDGDIRQNVAQPFRHELASIGVTHETGSSTISIRPSWEQEMDEGRGIGGTTLGTAGTTYYHREIDLTYNQQTIVRPTLVNQFQILVGHEIEPTTSVSPLPGIVVNGAFTGGGAQVDQRRTELHFQLSENLAATRGNHLLQIGFQVPDWSRRGFDDHSGFGGTYYFSDLAAYAAGTPYSYVQQTGNGRVVWLEKVLGAYVNDDWQIRPWATLSYGLRYDWSNYFHDHDTLAPRFSVALKPGGGSTVFRGGAGLFYDKIGPFPIVDVLDYQPGGLQRVVMTNPSYPDPYATGSAQAAPPSIAELAPGIQVPWTLQYSGGFERQLKTATLSVMYYGSDGRLLRSRDVNAPLPLLYAARPDPAYGVVRQIDASARQRGDSLQVTLRGRIARAFNGQVQYTLSRTMNDSGGLNWYPSNDYDLTGEWARADFDRRHKLVLLGTFLPAKHVSLGVALTVESGLPYTETLGTDPFNNGRGGARPAGVPRNSLQGASYADLDLRLSRDLTLGSGTRTLTVAIDAFNLLNRVNYDRYVGTVGSPLFGQPVSAQAPRQVQLSARVKF
jgi:Carboxypeptidase regulatory-like domain